MKNLITASVIISIIFSLSCKKEEPKKAESETPQLVETEIDVQKIGDLTGLKCKFLKTETIGYMPIYRFYWVCLPEKTKREKLEELAYAIIGETIIKKPNAFHSFTIHFFCEKEMATSLEKSKFFARANFLPEGSQLKVGRVPISDYKDYQLILTILE